MKNKRLGVGLAVVNRLLYAIGGYDGENRLSSCECYHPENDEWAYIKPMNVSRSGAGEAFCQSFGIPIRRWTSDLINATVSGVAALNQYIYVVGGYNGSNQLNTVERYDTEKDEWEFVAPMKIARSALSVSVLNDKLYAIGNSSGLPLGRYSRDRITEMNFITVSFFRRFRRPDNSVRRWNIWPKDWHVGGIDTTIISSFRSCQRRLVPSVFKAQFRFSRNALRRVFLTQTCQPVLPAYCNRMIVHQWRQFLFWLYQRISDVRHANMILAW